MPGQISHSNNISTEPFWTFDFARPDDLPIAAELPQRVYAAVIGSGYTGLNVARVLAQAGKSVAVFESQTIGWGASSRNGGMATSGLKLDLKKIYARYGADYAKEFWKASFDAIDLVDAIVRDEKIQCDWQRNGHVALALKQSHFDDFEKHANWVEKHVGYPKQLVEKKDLKREIGTDEFYGGLIDKTTGGLHPAKYVFGLANAVAKKGVMLYEHTPIVKVKKHGSGFQLFTSTGSFLAETVIVATNGYTDLLVKDLRPRIFPIGSYIIVTDPLPENLQQELSPNNRMFYDSKLFLNYFRLTPDGRMLWGGRNNLTTDLDLFESAKRLREQMIRVFPQLKNVPVTHSWTGRLGITFDLMPHIGEIDGIHYANGYCGHGVAVATYLGTELGLLLNGAKSRSPFKEIPTKRFPLYRNKTWFLPIAEKYHRFLDWVS